nr:RNA-directed DNA polymerase, eukaryota [Tanacetum cinerariifolium]
MIQPLNLLRISENLQVKMCPQNPKLTINVAPAAPAAVLTRVNDVFWEQFLTERPDSSDVEDTRVENVDRLVGNLCTLWIGRMHLHANVARFERTTSPPPRTARSSQPDRPGGFSFAYVLHGNAHPHPYISHSPALVLDDSRVVERDLEKFVMGELKMFSSIPNLHSILLKEGFLNINLTYMGGLWVMMELESIKTKENFLQHKDVSSWFHRVCNVHPDFMANERIVWVDIEGVPLHAWSCATFTKIFSKWGDVNELEEKVKEVEYCSDDESLNGEEAFKGENNNNSNVDNESDDDAVSDTCFGEFNGNLDGENAVEKLVNEKEQSSDPFGIFGFLGKKDDDPIEKGSTRKEPAKSLNRSICSRVVKDTHNLDVELAPDGRGSAQTQKKGGSVLEILDDIIKVGKAMGYSMEACKNTLKVKLLWGNYSFDYVFSESLGFSGGLLCVWDSSVFLIENHTILDNFLVLYGTWKPSKTKLLVISVYAPQALSEKRLLWNYISLLIIRWGGECIVMGDFNEVRCVEERMGSVFNIHGANAFNDFIANSSFIDVRLDGFSFTWSHPSATKMSRLDRFLVSDGFTSIFPYFSAICLDRHLSDHRPILLRDLVIDYGASPFCFYHSWLSWNGFDQMITRAWNSIFLMIEMAMVFKVDFTKAYDSIQWDYLVDVLRSFGFGDMWCSWIKGYLYSSMASILVNGSSTSEVQIDRGLKQRDPLAHYLFILVMESLHLSFSRVVESGIFKGINIDNTVTISHLFYADDAIFIREWSEANLNRIFQELFNGIQGVDKKITWIKWSKVLPAKQFGGLGVSSFFALNRALLFKWVWRFLSHDNSLWCRFISAVHGLLLQPRSSCRSSTWCSILREVNVLKSKGIDLVSHCKNRVGNGLLMRFWSDIWVGDTEFIHLFPRLYALELFKDICVAKKLQLSVESSFRHPVRGGIESSQLEQLLEKLRLVILSNSCDRWYWDLNGNGDFCVKDVRRLLDDFFLPKADVATRSD